MQIAYTTRGLTYFDKVKLAGANKTLLTILKKKLLQIKLKLGFKYEN